MTYAIDLKARKLPMDLGNLPTLIGALMAVFVSFGGGIKWMISRSDAHDLREREWITAEREKLETQFQGQIEALTGRLERQSEEVKHLRVDLAQYQRHVGMLEGLLRAHGVDAPPLKGL